MCDKARQVSNLIGGKYWGSFNLIHNSSSMNVFMNKVAIRTPLHCEYGFLFLLIRTATVRNTNNALNAQVQCTEILE